MGFDQANDDFVPLAGFANPCAATGREELGPKASQKLTCDGEDGRVMVVRQVGVWFPPSEYFDGGKAGKVTVGKAVPPGDPESGSCGRRVRGWSAQCGSWRTNY